MRERAARLRAAICDLNKGTAAYSLRLMPGGQAILSALGDLSAWVGEVEETLELLRQIVDIDRMSAELAKLQRVIDVASELGQLAPPIADRPGGPMPGDQLLGDPDGSKAR